MSYAELNMPLYGKRTQDCFLVLRAFHYLSEFQNISEIRLSFSQPAEDVIQTWKKSLELRKRNLVILYDRSMSGVPEFNTPELPVRINGKAIIDIGIPDIPDLTDFHVHTRLAYCSENMNVPDALELERLSGVKHVNFSEHSGQLYCSSDTYWHNRFLWKTRMLAEDRVSEYLNLRDQNGQASYGVELDVDADAVVSDIPCLSGFRIGAIHFLGNDLTYEEKKADFMRRLDALLACDIDILAHPFRIFSRSGLPVPGDLFEPVAERLVRTHTAAEINFHTNRPQPEFISLVLKKGGIISWGTDSHNLYEAGYFRPHYDFCKQLGIAGKLDQILL